MPDEDDIQKTSSNEDNLQESSPDSYDSSSNPVSMPKETIQEQIPPAHSKVSKKIIIKKVLILIAIMLIISAAAFAIWKFVIDKKDSAKTAEENQSQSQASQPDEADEPMQPEELTEDFKSDFLRLEFKYPQSWKVTETDNVILVKSPNFNLKDKSGNETISYFKVYIKRGANDADGKYLAKGYAIDQSQKIAYTEPASGQRKETNLTNFGIDTPDNFAYFVVQGNFNLAKGDSLGPKFAQEPDSFLIAGGFSDDQLQDGLATKIIGTDSYSNNQAYLTGIEIIKSLKLK